MKVQTSAIIILTNDKEKIINLENVKSLNITYEDGTLNLNYIEETTQVISTKLVQQNNLPKPAKEKKKTTTVKKKRVPKYSKNNIETVDEAKLLMAYTEYKEATKNKTGRTVAARWAEELEVNTSTLTVWLSQINQILENRATGNVPQKLFTIAGKI